MNRRLNRIMNDRPKPIIRTITDEELAAVYEREKAELEHTWARPRGVVGWFTDTDHKAIALRYIVTAFVFFLFGGVEALLMRIQ